MEEKIKREYNLDVNDLVIKNNYVMFVIDGNYFYLTKILYDMKRLDDVFKVYNDLKSHGYPVIEIVPTVFNSLIMRDKDDVYVLLVVRNPMDEYSLLDMLNIWDKFVLKDNQQYNRDWGFLWSEKIDYFEYQMRNLAHDKSVVINSFGYFVSLGENAISYVNRVNRVIAPKNKHFVLCRKRVTYPNYHLNYDNPLNFIFDLEVRDVAEYLKGEALVDLDYALIDLSTYLKMRNLDLYSLGMLYGRLLYPSYYFDLYESVMNYDVSDDCLLSIIEKTPLIEEFLRKSYDIIVKYGPIEKVNWL